MADMFARFSRGLTSDTSIPEGGDEPSVRIKIDLKRDPDAVNVVDFEELVRKQTGGLRKKAKEISSEGAEAVGSGDSDGGEDDDEATALGKRNDYYDLDDDFIDDTDLYIEYQDEMPFAEDLPGNSFVIWHGPVKKFFTEYLPEHPYEFGEPEEPAGGASSQASKSKGKKKAGGAAEKKTNGSATDKDKPKATRKKKTAEGAVASPPKGSPKKKAAAAVAATRSADISPISEDSSVEKTSSATPPQDTPVESTLPLSPPDDHSSAGPTPVQPVKKPPRKKSESKPEDQAEKAKPQRKKSTGGSDGDKVEKKKRAPKEVTATSPTSPAEISSELPVSLGATTDESSTPAPVVVAKPKKKRAAETLEKPESSKKARHSLPNIALGLAGASKRPVSSSENDPNAAAPPPKAKKPRKSMPAKIEGVVDAEAKKPRASKSSVPPPIDMDKVIDMGVERMSNFIREIGYTPGKAIPEGLHHSILRFSDEIFRADVSRLDDAFYTRLSTLLGQEQRKLKQIIGNHIIPKTLEKMKPEVQIYYATFRKDLSALIEKRPPKKEAEPTVNSDGTVTTQKIKFPFNDALRRTFWNILCSEWEMAKLDNEYQLLNDNEPQFSELPVRKAVYAKICSFFPDDIGVTPDQLSRIYSAFKKKVEMGRYIDDKKVLKDPFKVVKKPRVSTAAGSTPGKEGGDENGVKKKKTKSEGGGVKPEVGMDVERAASDVSALSDIEISTDDEAGRQAGDAP